MLSYKVVKSERRPLEDTRDYTVSVIIPLNGSELVAALFTGEYCSVAASEFSDSMRSKSTIADSIRAFNAAAESVDREWESLSEDERFVQGFAGTAWGIVCHLRGSDCQVNWLGDNRAFQIRQQGVLSATKPHTLYQHQIDHGQKRIEKVWKSVATRSLSRRFSPETVNWKLRPEDIILVCGRFVDEEMIPVRLEPYTPDELANSIVNNAFRHAPRISHVVLSIQASHPNSQYMERP